VREVTERFLRGELSSEEFVAELGVLQEEQRLAEVRALVSVPCGVCRLREGHDVEAHEAFYARVKAADELGERARVAP
jgi:hypothetical protein